VLVVGQPVPAALADAAIVDVEGAARALARCWSERDAVIVFVRHFACAGCSAHVAELRPRLEELAALDCAVALVGNGTPDHLAAFVERERLAGHPIEAYTDPTLAAYRAAELERSWAGTVGPRAVWNLVGLFARGHGNGRTRGDLVQQGGTLYVTRAGVLAFHHRSARLGDHARVVDVVAVALAARAATAAAAGLGVP
jgi:peroxiredoxin